jgi:assimilatory nitrate reductase catalytic subunit
MNDQAPPATIRTTCPYCGVGCGVLATPKPDGTVDIAGDPDHPANFGRLCSKGAALGETLSLDGRQLFPEVAGRRVGWDAALDLVASTFSQTIAEHGPDSVAFYGSGQLLTEDYYVANKLMKGFIGSGNIDTNSRLCMASSVAGHKRAFGADTVPGNYDDIEKADLVVLVGSNLAWCHPVIYQRLAQAKTERPHMRVVLIDPRRTMTADIADLHLAVNADGDTALFVGLLAELRRQKSIDIGFVETYTKGLIEALAAASTWTIARVAAATGLGERDVALFYDWFFGTAKVVTVFSQGVNQSATGTDKVNAIINCHLATGRIGLAGMGPFSITGQPNAMGGREVGGLANMLAAHMDFDADAIDRVGRFWGADHVASKAGLKAVELFEAVADGRVKALWILATNPVDSMPDADRVRAALRGCPFVVVSEMNRSTDTALEAHVRLPAAGWGEKDGTVTNSERRISRQRPFLAAPGEARPDWWIVTEVAKRMGFADAFPYSSPGQIFAEHAALSAFENDGRRDFDLSGLVQADYATMEPVQWPVRLAGTERLFGDGRFFTPDRRAQFVAITPPPPLRPAPGMFILNTGRVRDHWHTMTRTGKTARLSSHMAEPFAEIHPDDASRLGIHRASLVRLENQHGTALVRALITDRQQRGTVFVPMHWTDQFAANSRVDALVSPKRDPQSGQPALKMSQVSVEPAGARFYGFAVSRLRPWLTGPDYWAIAEAAGGLRTELAWLDPPADWDEWVRGAFKVAPDATMLSVRDARSGRLNFALFEAGQLVFAVFLSPEPVLVSRQWAAGLLSRPLESVAHRSDVLAGRPGADMPDSGAIICACFSVGINSIVEAVTKRGCHSVEAIGAALKAGTNCGSCRAEIRGIINANRLASAE